MNIEDQGIILKINTFQENAQLVNCFTQSAGLLTGFYKRKKNSMIQPGQLVHVIYKARLEEHLGTMYLEPIKNYIGQISFEQGPLLLIEAAISILLLLLRQNDVHKELFDAFKSFLDILISKNDIEILVKEYCLLELKIMSFTGYGLDLEKCVVTKSKHNLKYISPKSGCAVSEKVGAPYDEKLFKMPLFYLDKSALADPKTLDEALQINKFFLYKNIVQFGKLPEARLKLNNLILKEAV